MLNRVRKFKLMTNKSDTCSELLNHRALNLGESVQTDGKNKESKFADLCNWSRISLMSRSFELMSVSKNNQEGREREGTRGSNTILMKCLVLVTS